VRVSLNAELDYGWRRDTSTRQFVSVELCSSSAGCVAVNESINSGKDTAVRAVMPESGL
jgi:hypothetical protein